ncbi:WAP four-disulfide core domain protein 6 [Frankliniella fusca]|uniref:WAP four-disulfide core domain protein 6 n=1 Tax=Frankliniella fusca TaxID=407009 RepID=A0AAE1LIN9_9NEOP|nr:WAP four-disulfide core domain protein 6 [Frankliniella fusca]
MAHVEARLCAVVSVRRLYTVCYYRRAPPPPHRGATATRRHLCAGRGPRPRVFPHHAAPRYSAA